MNFSKYLNLIPTKYPLFLLEDNQKNYKTINKSPVHSEPAEILG